MAKQTTAGGAKRRLEAETSKKKLLYIFAGSFSFVLIGASFMLGQNSFGFILGTASVIFFGYTGFVAIKKMLTEKGVILSIGPEGVLDVRLHNETIPWFAIKSASTWSHRGQRFVTLELTPEFEATLPTGFKDMALKGANQLVGSSGLALSASGLNTSFKEMKEVVSVYKRVE